MRNNEDRFSAPDRTENSTAAVMSKNVESGLNFSVPTEIVDLPSAGKFYPPGHPLHGKSTIEIKFMTAKEEDILTSKALIKKGIAIDRMLQSLIVDKTIKVEELLVGDKNALVVAARISGYGEDYDVSMNCPSCEAKCKHNFNLSLIQPKELKSLEELAVKETEQGTFTTPLFRTQATVEFRLLTGKDEISIMHEMELQKKSPNNVEKNSTSQLKRAIVSVDGVTDRSQITRFIDNLPALDARFLRSLFRNINPELDMNQVFECASCGYEEEMEVPFTVEFFWPK